MDVSFLEEAFPTQLKAYVANYQKRAEEKYSIVAEERDRANEERNKANEERDQQRLRADLLEEERNRNVRQFKAFLIDLVSKRYETASCQNVFDKIQAARSMDALFDILRLIQRFNSIEEFEQKH